jgi:polar amino acid transport system substrate-binding protein
VNLKLVSDIPSNILRPLFCLLLLLVVSTKLQAQNDTITVLTEEWPPYNYTERGQLKGFSVEVVQQIVKDLQLDATFEIYPSMRASYMLENEPGNMFISMFRTPAREDKYHWVGPLVDSSIYFYKKKGNPLVVNSIEEAKGVNLIATRHAGLVYSQLKNAGFTNLDNNSIDGISVYKKLLSDRCDLGISDSALGVSYILKQLGYRADALIQTPVKVVDAELYIAVSKDISSETIEQWQQSLEKLKRSGVYDQILKKYSE